MAGALLVAATDMELCGHEGLVCGVGPVEAAAATARAIALDAPDAVLLVGVAGARRITPGALVVGTEAVYCDLEAEIPIVSRVEPDARLLALVRAEFPDAPALPIGTTAIVGGPCGSEQFRLHVEAMEGFAVLRACELAGVPAVEVRAVSNEIGEGDRARWKMRRGIEVLDEAVPRLLAAVGQ